MSGIKQKIQKGAKKKLAYLIAQRGKNYIDKARERITGQELLEAVIRQTQICSGEIWAATARMVCFIYCCLQSSDIPSAA